MKAVVHEYISRSVAKALTFRALAVVTNGIIVFFITKRLDFTFGVVLLTNFINTLLYILHERMWNKVHWGRHHKKLTKN